jgi:putative serine protease PepD
LRVRQRSLSSFLALLAVGGLGGAAALRGAAALDGSHGSAPVAGSPPSLRLARAGAERLSLNQISRRDGPGVVELSAARQETGAARVLGSGFVIDSRGDTVTCDCVIADAGSGLRVSLASGASYRATVVGRDHVSGVALLRIGAAPQTLTPLPLGDSDGVHAGDRVVLLGGLPGARRAARAGVVRALTRPLASGAGGCPDDAILTDVRAGRSSSGGPLIDARGQVIGVGVVRDGTVSAIPSNSLTMAVARILRHGRV